MSTESHVLYVYYTDIHERVWIHTHTRVKSDGANADISARRIRLLRT